MEKKAIRVSYGDTLVELGDINKNIVVLDADLSHSTMTNKFRAKYPSRFFNLGIAEQNLMNVAAGFAITGKIPFVSTFAIFGTGRAYEQVRNSIAYANLNVKIALTHAGVTVGEDGGSHQALEDISLMRTIPNMTVISPCDAIEVRKAIIASLEINGPVYIRMGRAETEIITDDITPFKIGSANILRHGKDICIFATGIMVAEALKAAEKIENDGKSVSVVNIHTIKPIDRNTIIEMAKHHERLFSVEEHNIIGGLGSAISEVLCDEYPKKLKRLGVNDEFGQSGKPFELLKHYKLDALSIYESIKSTY